jgi:Mn-dependent DtxR family transcriptional regulator
MVSPCAPPACAGPRRQPRSQRRGVTRGTTHVRQAPATRVDDEVIKRLGKTCGAVIDVLDGRGTATIREIADVLQISRHRDLRRRVIARLEERGIVTVSGDEKVMLVGNWLERLNEERERSGEIERLESDMRRYDEQRANRYCATPTVDAKRGEDVVTRSHARRREAMMEDAMPAHELETVPDSDPTLVATLREFLRTHPDRRDERPSWYAVALWADNYVRAKPTPLAVEAALYELRSSRAA